PCSVFLFEKCIAEKLHKPRRREIVTNVLKREVRLLTQLRHPYLLHAICPIEETNDTLAFATEPVIASLANLLGNHTRMPNVLQPAIKDFHFDELNRKLGIYQVSKDRHVHILP
ncbi:hypothetical protein P879_02837, partial [Paragonimus westermani]